FLLADRTDAPPLVVVTGVDQRVFGQRKQLASDAPVELRRVAALEIGAPTTADEQRVAGEQPIAPQKTGAAGRVARRGEGAYDLISEYNHPTIVEQPVESGGPAVAADCGRRPGRFPQAPGAGHVIGVDVRLQDECQGKPEFPDQRQVALGLLMHWIDDHSQGGPAAGKKIRVCRGGGIEELAKYHNETSHARDFRAKLNLPVLRRSGKPLW